MAPPAAKRRVIELLASEAAAEPRRLKERLAWWQQLRYLEVGTASLDLLARDTDTLIVHPLLAPPFWNAVAAAWGPHGFADRTEGMRRLFGDLLPKRSSRAARRRASTRSSGPNARVRSHAGGMARAFRCSGWTRASSRATGRGASRACPRASCFRRPGWLQPESASSRSSLAFSISLQRRGRLNSRKGRPARSSSADGPRGAMRSARCWSSARSRSAP